jgi:hypothetical protein
VVISSNSAILILLIAPPPHSSTVKLLGPQRIQIQRTRKTHPGRVCGCGGFLELQVPRLGVVRPIFFRPLRFAFACVSAFASSTSSTSVSPVRPPGSYGFGSLFGLVIGILLNVPSLRDQKDRRCIRD